MFKTIRDILAPGLVLVMIPGLWIAEALGALKLPEAVIGATILQWGLVIQFYFRKKGSNGGTS